MQSYHIANVAVENTAFHFDAPYSYRIPDDLLGSALPGCRVRVPFGNSSAKRQGVILSVEHPASCTKKLKPIFSMQDAEPVFNAEGLRLIRFLHERTFCTLYEAAKAILPSGLGYRLRTSYAAVPEDRVPSDALLPQDKRDVLAFLREKGSFVSMETLCRKTCADEEMLRSLCMDGFIARNDDTVRNVSDLTVKSVRLCEPYRSGSASFPKLTAKQKSVVNVLRDVGTASVKEICYFTGLTAAVPTALAQKGIVEFISAEQYRTPYASSVVQPDQGQIILSDEQEKAYLDLCALYEKQEGAASLLFGVTGSGKTKVYMKMIDRVLDDGKGVILLVPEISLTPQAMQLFRARYGDKVAVFHSALSVGERLDEWKRIRRGEAQIAIGTRSAVFAPFERLGMIVMDEEQEGAYKSESTPRYHARDVARFRCAEHHALLLLSSATPSIETYAAAQAGRYALNTLTRRYGPALLPDVVTVDMIAERRNGNTSSVSAALRDALLQTVQDGRQAILLMNRRGYQTFASCTSCGTVLMCPSCSISMTYHKANGRLMCHYCGYSTPFSPVCPSCGEHAVQFAGFGTQKIEDELHALVPDARILRMDADTTMSRFAHEDKLRAFASGEYDILLGTQMVAKGLDFENVTLVGVISVDSLLYNDDYRALERTFDLLMQVVGRSGRGQYAGKAIIQTTAPENDVLQMAARQDYPEFYRTEIGIRKMLTYPPYCDMCAVLFAGEDELFTRGAAKLFMDILVSTLREESYRDEKLIVLGPAPARVLRISGKYRYRLILKCKNSARFRTLIASVLQSVGRDKRFTGVSIAIDINPESIL